MLIIASRCVEWGSHRKRSWNGSVSPHCKTIVAEREQNERSIERKVVAKRGC